MFSPMRRSSLCFDACALRHAHVLQFAVRLHRGEPRLEPGIAPHDLSECPRGRRFTGVRSQLRRRAHSEGGRQSQARHRSRQRAPSTGGTMTDDPRQPTAPRWPRSAPGSTATRRTSWSHCSPSRFAYMRARRADQAGAACAGPRRGAQGGGDRRRRGAACAWRWGCPESRRRRRLLGATGRSLDRLRTGRMGSAARR